MLSIAILAIAVAAAGYAWLRTSVPDLGGTERLARLSSIAEVVYDRNGVPHITAASPADAYRALGYVHARDRLFQMDFMRRLGAGRLSEVVGPQTVRIDRTMRILGLYRLAKGMFDRLPRETRDVLVAYAEGVNAWLDRSDAMALPPEFLLLGYRPYRWIPADSLVWGRLMALRLAGNWQTEALRAAFSSRLSPDQIADLWPRKDGGVPPTVPADADSAALPALFGRMLAQAPDEIARVSASNSWAVTGAGSATGRPVLANDPHLGFRAPVLWYLARMSAPGLDLTGATVPGVPFHILGHNGRVAWAFTTTESDTQDLFVERPVKDRENAYETPDGPSTFAQLNERIEVKGEAPVELVVRETRHGPVVSDLVGDLKGFAEPGDAIALAAMALAPDDETPNALVAMNRARDTRGFRDALRQFHAPQQNITYADVDGNIAFIAAGRIPIRKKGDGSVPVPGWSGEYDWSGFVPFAELPQVENPPSGRIVSANHRVTPPGYRWHLTHDWAAPYRAARIHAVLDALIPHDLDAAAALQTDVKSGAAVELLPVMLGLLDIGSANADAVEILLAWDGNMGRDRPAPLIFSAWLAAVNRGLYADELGEMFPRYFGPRAVAVHRMLTERRVWCDDVRTDRKEDCAAIVTSALARAMDSLTAQYGDRPAEWRWGTAHPASFRHPVLTHVPVVRRLADIDIESGGGAYTVNRAQYRPADREAPFASVHGPEFRAIYDLSDLSASRFAIATGQSGNPLSSRYSDRVRGWRDGRYLTIPQDRTAALDGALGVLKLVPIEE